MVLEKIKDILSGGGQGKEEPEEREKISLDDMGERLEEEKERSLEEVEGDVEPLLAKISNILDKIRDLEEDLSDAESAEEVHPNLYKSSKEAKRLLLKKVNRASERIDVPEETGWDKLLSFNRSLQKTNNLLKNAIVSHGQQVGALFSGEMDRLRRLTSRLKSLSKDLNTSLRKRKLRLDDFDELSDNISERDQIIEKKGEMEEKIEELESQREELEEELEDEKDSLESLEKSQRFEKLEDMKGRRKNLDQRKERVRRKIDSMISDLARPLRKMDKMIERGEHMVSHEVLDGLDLYLDDPAQAALSEEEGLPKLKATLEELKTLLDGKMKLGERERRKRLEEVREIVDEDGIEELRDKYFQYEEKSEELKEEIESSSLLDKREKLEESIDKRRSELERKEEGIGKIEKELSDLQGEVEEKEDEIREETISILDAEVKELS